MSKVLTHSSTRDACSDTVAFVVEAARRSHLDNTERATRQTTIFCEAGIAASPLVLLGPILLIASSEPAFGHGSPLRVSRGPLTRHIPQPGRWRISEEEQLRSTSCQYSLGSRPPLEVNRGG